MTFVEQKKVYLKKKMPNSSKLQVARLIIRLGKLVFRPSLKLSDRTYKYGVAIGFIICCLDAQNVKYASFSRLIKFLNYSKRRPIMRLFNKEKHADVHFLVGRKDKKIIPAHREILEAGSEVFAELFNSQINLRKPIDVPEIKPDVFLNVLRPLYGGSLRITTDTVFDTYYAAIKYRIRSAIAECEIFILGRVTSESVFYLLNKMKFVRPSEFITQCFEKIAPHAEKALNSDEFLDLSHSMLLALLSTDPLACSEITLFKKVVEWSTAECGRFYLNCTPENRRLVLQDALDLIRFPCMSQEEFLSYVLPTDILHATDLSKLFRWYEQPNPHIKYSTTNRNRYLKENEYCVEVPLYAGRAAFSADNTIYVLGVYTKFKSSHHGIRLNSKKSDTLLFETDMKGLAMCHIKFMFSSPVRVKKRSIIELEVTETVPKFQHTSQLKQRNSTDSKVTFSYMNKCDGKCVYIIYKL